jgi:hypothetical protein
VKMANSVKLLIIIAIIAVPALLYLTGNADDHGFKIALYYVVLGGLAIYTYRNKLKGGPKNG